MKKLDKFYKTEEKTEKKKNNKVWLIFKLAILFFLISWTIYGIWTFFSNYQLQSPVVLRMPFKAKNFKLESPTASQSAKMGLIPKVYAEEKTYSIEQDIKDVFGEYSDKAFLLLSCENKSLNPKAHNDNTTWGGVGQDLGVFQINTKWQKIENENFLYDPAINIRVAYNIFSRDGFTFKLWTCGRQLGI